MSLAVRVAGRYELVRPLGHGAMAVVDLARDLELDRLVALKRLAENLARDDEVRRRFLREARLAARLAHPNVVRVFDVGQDGDAPFIAMEYVEGETLAQAVARRGPLPAAEVAALGLQACAALAAAHAAGLVHRDVKPQNLLLGADGVLKLGDFGIAAGQDGTRLTVAGTVLGTAGYLAPEQARGEQVTAAADLYGLGCVLYELLSGEPPRRAFSLAELATAAPDPLAVRRRLRGAPRDLVAAVADCLAERPEDRPPSAAALARRLAPLAREDATLPLPADPARRASEILAPPPPRRRRLALRLAAAAALAASALAGLALALVLTGGGRPVHAPPGSTARAVPPPPRGASALQQARDLAAWLRRHAAPPRRPRG